MLPFDQTQTIKRGRPMRTTSIVLMEAKRLTKIAYSDKPLPQQGKITYLTPEEFEKKFGFVYSESLYGDRNELAKYINNPEYTKLLNDRHDLPNIEKIKERLKNPLDCLVLCDMGPVGHGLYTSVALPPGSVLFLYAGMIGKQGNHEYSFLYDAYGDQANMIDAKQIGGLSRFMQHLPINFENRRAILKKAISEKFDSRAIEAHGINIDEFIDEIETKSKRQHSELDDLRFLDSSTKSNIQDCNVILSNVVVDGIPLVVVWTQDGVEANSQLGFPYGTGYWLGSEVRYFYKNGALVPLSAYQASEALSFLHLENPFELYQKGIEHQKQNQNELALKFLKRALTKFEEKDGTELERGNCYSAMASVLRDRSLSGKAAEACEYALELYLCCLDKVTENQLQKLKIKYWSCLDQLKPSFTQCYEEATKDFKSQKYHRAIFKLEYILNNQVSAALLASTHSTLASAYRELKQLPTALEHARKALDIRSRINCDIKLLEQSKVKLNQLEEMRPPEVSLKP